MIACSSLRHGLPCVSVLLTLALASCITVPPQAVPTCSSDSDCNQAAGEVCDEQVCWGNPPAGPFAAIVAPPAVAKNRVAAEYPQFAIEPHGWLGDLVVDSPIALAGKIAFDCKDNCGPLTVTMIAARPSKIPGAASMRLVTTIDSSDGADTSYRLLLPRTSAADEPYQITVTAVTKATGSGPSNQSIISELPPQRIVHSALVDSTRDLRLSSVSESKISGRIVDFRGQGLPGYKVYATGQWPADTAPSLVSTTTISDQTGNYSLSVARDIATGVTVIAEPNIPGAGVLRAGLGQFRGNAVGINLSTTEQLGSPVTVELKLSGTNGSGEIVPAAGVVVSTRAVIDSPRVPLYSMRTELGDSGTTDNNGIVRLQVVGFQGANLVNYSMQFQPPATSPFQAVYNMPFTINDSPLRQLEPRVSVRGIVVDATGTPLKDVSVTARPSSAYLAGLDKTAQEFANQLALGSGSSDEQGEFVIFVDPPFVNGTAYDLVFEPSETSEQPTWTVDQAVIPVSRSSSMAAGPFSAPEPARIHGRVTDSAGRPMSGGELRILRPGSDDIGARLLGRGVADENGIVRLTLPR
jgi:hypothetical protein